MAKSIIDIEKCVELVDNRFKLVLLASQRTHDLNTGASNPIESTKFKIHKSTIIALYEIAKRQVDTNELFTLLVNRCKEYMKGNVNNSYNSKTSQLEKLLNFSNRNFNIDYDINQENINIKDNSIKAAIDNQNNKEINNKIDNED